MAEGGGIEPQPLQSPTVFETVFSPAEFTFQNTHNERALAYLLRYTQPAYDYTALLLFRNPGFLLCVLTGSEKGIRTLVPVNERTDFQSGRLDQLSHLTKCSIRYQRLIQIYNCCSEQFRDGAIDR
jgi:hypothetical protein